MKRINNPLAFVVNNLFIVESGLDGLGCRRWNRT